jgi:hypothetical protein
MFAEEAFKGFAASILTKQKLYKHPWAEIDGAQERPGGRTKRKPPLMEIAPGSILLIPVAYGRISKVKKYFVYNVR